VTTAAIAPKPVPPPVVEVEPAPPVVARADAPPSAQVKAVDVAPPAGVVTSPHRPLPGRPGKPKGPPAGPPPVATPKPVNDIGF
jgi:hypothetical protein